jgi:hypothetical protein
VHPSGMRYALEIVYLKIYVELDALAMCEEVRDVKVLGRRLLSV